MSIFAAPNFYNTVDQNIYSGGDRFITQEPFRLGAPIQKNISFSSPSTSGIAGLPIPILPPINQGGGGEGPGGGFNTDTEDQSTTADDFGSGLEGDDPSMNMTEEEKDAIDAYNNPATTKGMMGTIGATMFGFMNPLTAMFSLNYQKNKAKEKAMEEAKAAATAARAAENKAAGNRGGYQSDFGNKGNEGFMEGPAGAGYGMGASDKGGSDSMGSFAYGGRVPYMMGGLANLVDIYD